MRNHRYWYVIALVALASPRIASAQYNVPSQASGDSKRSLEIADDGQQPGPAPPGLAIGWEVGASLDFLTSDPSLGGRKLKFTDVVLFRTHGLLALGRRTELFAGIDLLPKQPSYTDELVWQGALLGVRYRLTELLSAYVRGHGGPGLGRDGSWVVGEAALQSQVHLAEKALFWESALGGTYTQLFPDEPVDRAFWQAELLARSGIAVRERRGFFATWLAFTFQFPLVARPSAGSPDPASMRSIDPQTRVGVALGMLIGVTNALDLFAEVSILDRGDLDDPTTTLPILAGGFDQRRIVFGFNRRLGKRRR
jgi:hypothetical protein